MINNRVKQTLAAGGVSVGTMVFEFATTGIARIVAQAGAEFVIFDMEHTGFSIETIRMLLATSRAGAIVPMVRVPVTEYHFIARALDLGAMGIMVPMVESAEQARRIVQSCKYPPVGRRGAAFTVAHDDYSSGDLVPKIESANRETLLIAQIETAEGVRNVEEIAGANGIDVLWIGHFDLSNSLGIPGQFTHPQFQASVAKVLAACTKHGKAPGFMCSDVAGGQSLIDQGFRMLSYGGDLWTYQAALREGISGLRRGLK
jgi:2-dehydro-3-deoxyglucarate aldolase/4-hydroxy-2-oxoheptanedioate aldolase